MKGGQMTTLGEIKQLMAAGDTAQADEALKKLLAKEPDNLQAKMLYGTCCQLLGDEETFRRIHDELAPVMERMGKEEPKAETVSLWEKYQRLWESLIVAGLFVACVGTAAWIFGKDILNTFGMADVNVAPDGQGNPKPAFDWHGHTTAAVDVHNKKFMLRDENTFERDESK